MMCRHTIGFQTCFAKGQSTCCMKACVWPINKKTVLYPMDSVMGEAGLRTGRDGLRTGSQRTSHRALKGFGIHADLGHIASWIL
jgi:hypothetical protein